MSQWNRIPSISSIGPAPDAIEQPYAFPVNFTKRPGLFGREPEKLVSGRFCENGLPDGWSGDFWSGPAHKPHPIGRLVRDNQVQMLVNQ